jgi:hypothetical protein
MSHFAEIDGEGTVLRVLVVADDKESRGQEFLAIDLNLGGTWIQTSYNGSIRKYYAGIGDLYDSSRDAFISPKPFPSFVLNEQTCRWQAPVSCPSGELHRWDEDSLNWVLVQPPV